MRQTHNQPEASTPDFAGACAYALERLERDLDQRLYYHSLVHTRDDVVPAARRLAAQLGVSGEPLLLLTTAAYYHDIGFIEQRIEHERVGVQIATQVLPRFGYQPEQLAQVAAMIMATRMPQTPVTLLETIIADADLDALGREDFFVRNQALRDELAVLGHTVTDTEWYRGQIAFLNDHSYWTSAARAQRDGGKARHLRQLERLLEELTGAPHPAPRTPAG